MKSRYFALLLVVFAPVAHATSSCLQKEIASLKNNKMALELAYTRIEFNFNGDQFDPNNAPILKELALNRAMQSGIDQKISDLTSGKVAPDCNSAGLPAELPSCNTLANVAAWYVGRALYNQYLAKSLKYAIVAFNHSSDFTGSTVGEWRTYVQNAYVIPLEAHYQGPIPKLSLNLSTMESNKGGVAQQLPDSQPIVQAFAGLCRSE